jgi:hypothetical protein
MFAMASAFIIAQTEALNQRPLRYLQAGFSLRILHGEGAVWHSVQAVFPHPRLPRILQIGVARSKIAETTALLRYVAL